MLVMKKIVNKRLIVSFMFVVAVVLLSSGVLADQKVLLCLGNGEKILYSECNPVIPDFTCFGTQCQRCVTQLDNGAFCPTSPNSCNGLGLECNVISGGGGGTIDAEAPILIVNSPIQDEIYNGRRVLFDLETNEPSTLTYTDDGGRRIKNLGRNLFSYSRQLNLKDGPNTVTIFAADRNDNTAEHVVSFFVDSTKPRLGRPSPSRGYANGVFEIYFTEVNPDSLILNYGNEVVGFRTASVDLNTCNTVRNKVYCSIEVALADYDGDEISYYFELTDIADNKVSSRPISLLVDDSDPVIESLVFETDKRNVFFTIEVTEPFLDSVFYRYVDNRGREIEKKICSRLKDGVCSGKASFRDGDYTIEVVARDDAGNEYKESISFSIDSRAPRFRSNEPKRGFANGEFTVVYDETNPNSLVLNYGNDETGFRDSVLNLDDCTEGRRGTSCTANVDLDDYDGEEISYHFAMEDKVGNSVQSRSVKLDVDITDPVILDDPIFTQGVDRNARNIYFDFEIEEDNFDEVFYVDRADPMGRERRICSRLRNDRCIRRVSFRPGHYVLDIQVVDEAANSVGTSIEFDV